LLIQVVVVEPFLDSESHAISTISSLLPPCRVTASRRPTRAGLAKTLATSSRRVSRALWTRTVALFAAKLGEFARVNYLEWRRALDVQ
jgi:hypothetical protein